MRIVIAAALTLTLASTAQAQSAEKRTEGLIEAFKKVKEAPEEGELSATDKKANEAAFATLDSYFDYEALTSGPIEPHAKAFSAAELEKFKNMFRETIRLVAYPRSGSFLSKAKLTIEPAKGNDVNLKAYLAEEDLETNVTFHWKNDKGALRLVDVSFDGASLVRDYQNQFGRIIKKDGKEGLMKKLESRLAKERDAQL